MHLELLQFTCIESYTIFYIFIFLEQNSAPQYDKRLD